MCLVRRVFRLIGGPQTDSLREEHIITVAPTEQPSGLVTHAPGQLMMPTLIGPNREKQGLLFSDLSARKAMQRDALGAPGTTNTHVTTPLPLARGKRHAHVAGFLAPASSWKV